MLITVDIATKKMTDATGSVALSMIDHPHFFYGTQENLQFVFLSDGEPVEFADSDTFTVALDNNFIHTDSLMASSSDATIIDADAGRVDVLLDMTAESFNTKLNGAESINAYIEATVLHAGETDLLITWLFKITMGEEAKYYMASVVGILVFVVVAGISLIVYNVLPSIKNEEDFQ